VGFGGKLYEGQEGELRQPRQPMTHAYGPTIVPTLVWDTKSLRNSGSLGTFRGIQYNALTRSHHLSSHLIQWVEAEDIQY
jgi:hypothetical protein